jgi:outer membrane protein OmpA-like peptidoglycan-associated protein
VSSTTGGVIVGAASGAAMGGIAGAASGTDPRVAALIGAGIGAIAGGTVGAYMDQQEAELRSQLRATGVSVTRVRNQILVNMPANITFAVDQALVQPQFVETLNAVALVLKKYNKTIIDVYGYTDSSGPEAYNNELSQRRAVAVATRLANGGVDQRRFYIEGRGEADPVASNTNEIGRAQNRRVEIQISPLG